MAYTINLTHRGKQVIECIDLFDEASFGADKLYFRGSFCCPNIVIDQIKIALGDTSKIDYEDFAYEFNMINDDATVTDEIKNKINHMLGIGNPLTQETNENGEVTVPTIALNRFHIPNKKFWNNEVPTDEENPYKASTAVRFSIRVHFRDDYAYIDFGCPWELVENGNISEESNAQTIIDNFVLLHCHFISKDDALQILKIMFPNIINVTESVKAYKRGEYNSMAIVTTELVDKDGSIISL